jgi:tetratricopeptide (TPR) repeat protein
MRYSALPPLFLAHNCQRMGKRLQPRRNRKEGERGWYWQRGVATAVLLFLFSASAPLVHGVSNTQQMKFEIGKPSDAAATSALQEIEHDIAANKFGDVESRLNDYLKDHPQSPKAHYDLGYVQFRTHNVGSSIEQLSKSLELDSSNAEAHKILALDCSIIGRYDLAEVELQEAARLEPKSGEIHYFLARTYYTRGVYPLAKAEFETAIRLDPSFVKAYSNLGITMEALGNNEEALKNYTRAIELAEEQKQKSEWPYIYLSTFYNRQQNAADALSYARKAVEINPRSDAAYFEMAKAYRSRKELQKSADAAKNAIAIDPQAQYYYVLASVLRELGNQQQSAEAMAKYVQLQERARQAQTEQVVQEPMVSPEPK